MKPLHVRLRRRARREARLRWGRLTWRLRPAPDFTIIGAQRCGTTSLFADLARHPQVIEAATKEIHYLDLEHSRGESWYRSHFPTKRDLNVARRRHGVAITGEATPNYLFHPYAARWARHEWPTTRIIVLLRNPIDRAFSHWKLMTRIGHETLPFDEALAEEVERTEPDRLRLESDPHHRAHDLLRFSYLARGRYAAQLEPWLRHLGRDRFVVVRSEDLYADPESVYRGLTDFLGLDPWLPGDFSHHNQVSAHRMLAEARHDLEITYKPHNDRLEEMLGPRFRWE